MAAKHIGNLGRKSAVVLHDRPVVSLTSHQAKLNVLRSYKNFQRGLPKIWFENDLNSMPLSDFRLTIKNEYMKYKHVTDIRVIDRLVHRANTELMNAEMYFTNYDHIRNMLFKENIDPKPTDFLSRFLAGKD